jgi:hypothetical protein
VPALLCHPRESVPSARNKIDKSSRLGLKTPRKLISGAKTGPGNRTDPTCVSRIRFLGSAEAAGGATLGNLTVGQISGTFAKSVNNAALSTTFTGNFGHTPTGSRPCDQSKPEGDRGRLIALRSESSWLLSRARNYFGRRNGVPNRVQIPYKALEMGGATIPSSATGMCMRLLRALSVIKQPRLSALPAQS